MTIGTSLAVIAIGAILTFAVNVESRTINLDAVGVILMIVGLIGLAYGTIRFLRTRRASTTIDPIE